MRAQHTRPDFNGFASKRSISGKASPRKGDPSIAKETELIRCILGENRPIDFVGLYEALITIKPREELVLRYRFGIHCNPLTLSEVGVLMGIQRERVRQLEASGIEKLRQPNRMRLFCL